MYDKNAKKFRRFLFGRGTPSNVFQATDASVFTKSEALSQCPFGCSVYRELLADAHARGLVIREDQKKPVLNIPTLSNIEEIHEVRLKLENDILQRVALVSAQGRTKRERVRQQLGQIHEELVGLVRLLGETKDQADRMSIAEDVWDVDGDFHTELACLAEWPDTGQFLMDRRDRLRFVSTADVQIVERASDIVLEHEAIYLAVTRQYYDRDAVENAIDAHLTSTIEVLEKEIKRRNRGRNGR